MPTEAYKEETPAQVGASFGVSGRIKGTDETCDVLVKRVTEYPDFESLLDGEGPANVNPTSSREQQLANIRSIYPPEKERLGAFAIEVELLNQ
ncbi:hypothetical protein [Streptomyces taklimakanensis]|uniref:hypothetical protein n=1 Tax=Streptomyces taklimakanensis TaxID=2569853 RepID=UPI003B75C4FD